MEKSKKQEKLSDGSTRTCACDIINNVSEQGKVDFETICNFADKFVSSQKVMSAEIADIADKHFLGDAIMSVWHVLCKYNNRKRLNFIINMNTTFNSLMSLLGFPYDEEAYREKALKSTKSFRDMVTNSKTISGSFDKLNEDEQQKVVDSFNKVNDLFGDFFGVTPERYTKDDFKGANVSVTTSSNEEDKDKKVESANVTTKEIDATAESKKNETPAKEKEQTLCESLYEEMMRETLSVEDAADMISEKVVSILKDKKEKRYSIIPGTKDKYPYASVEISLNAIFKSEEELTFYTRQKELKEMTIEKLKKTTGSRAVEVIVQDDYSWTVRIALK